MVVFTCNNCGSSVKKPKVEKHITECKNKRSNVSLCCADCLVDFNCETYVGHVKCLTESEKYNGPNYVPKPSSNKGEKKQESWTDAVKSVLKNPSITKRERKLLESISNFQNIPRKKIKFQNFMKSTFKYEKLEQQEMDYVHELIDNEFKSTQGENISQASTNSSPGNNSEQKTVKIESELNNNTSSTENENNFEIVEKKKSKKKKSKNNQNDKDFYSQNIQNLESVDKKPLCDEYITNDVTINTKEISIKKQKKLKLQIKLSDDYNANEAVGKENEESTKCIPNTDCMDENVAELDKPKEKKKKKTRENENLILSENCQIDVVENNNTATTEFNNDLCNEKLTKKERKEIKKRLKYEAELKSIEAEPNLAINNDNKNENVIDENCKSKKKRKIAENDTDEVTQKKKCKFVETTENCENTESNNKKFVWEEIIKTLLLKANNQEMSLKKISKKVVNEYLATYPDRKTYEEVLKRFNKKIIKISCVTVLKDKVKLASEL